MSSLLASTVSFRLTRYLTLKKRLNIIKRTDATVTTPNQANTPVVVSSSPPPASSYIRGTRKPIGGFRGGITGFLLGTSLAAGYGYYYLLTGLATQSTALTGTISDLQASTNALQSYISKIDDLEKEFKKLEDQVVDKEGLEDIRGEFKRTVLGVRGEGLELKERIVGLEKDVALLTRSSRTQLQPQS